MRLSPRLLPAFCALALTAPAGLIAPAAALAANTPTAPAPPTSPGATLVDTSQLEGALGTLMSSSAATTLAGELARIQANPSTADTSLLDQTLNGLLPGASTVALPIRTTTAAAALESALAGVGALAPANPSAAQSQALAELSRELTSAGLGALLGTVTTTPATPVGELTALAKLAPGASVSAGALSAVGSLAAGLAATATTAGASQSAGDLGAAASILQSSTSLSPGQLEAAVSDLTGVTSAAPVSAATTVTVAQLASALAGQLAQSGSLMGALASAGSAFSALGDPGDLSGALGQLAGLSGLAPNATMSLSNVAQALSALAATPGISSAAAGALASAATTLASTAGTSAGQVLGTISDLSSAVSDLSPQLATLVGELGSTIRLSGALFGAIANLSQSDDAQALAELSTLAGLGPGQSTPALPGIAAVLNLIGPDIPAADTADSSVLSELTQVIAANPLTPDELAGTAEAVADIAQTLPAAQSPTISALASGLSADAGAMGGVANLIITPTVSPISTPASSFSTTAGSVAGSGSESLASTRQEALSLTRARRVGDHVVLTLTCGATSTRRCAISARASGPGLGARSAHASIRPGHHARLSLSLSPARAESDTARASDQRRARPRITVVVRSSGHRIVTSLR